MLNFESITASLAIGSAVIGYLAYRLMTRDRGVDLHGEVTNERASLRCVAERLPELMRFAKQSRIASAESQGLLGSEGMQRWFCELEIDLAEAKTFGSQVPESDIEPTDLVMELDIRLVEILGLSIRANRLADKYRLALSVDEAQSTRLLEHSRSLAEPPLALKPSISLVAPS